MPLWGVFAVIAAVGVVVTIASALALGATGADPRTGRRLAGAPEVKVGALASGAELPDRPVRVSGRIRCRDPLNAPGSEPLVLYHRDVSVRLPRHGWRSLERLRESRSFDLWDHAGSLAVDPSLAAEPVVALPSVWRGDPSRLGEPYRAAAERLSERHGSPLEARAITRTISVTDRLLVLAVPVRQPDGSVALRPPEGGYVITNLALADAMRLLGGRHRRTMVASLLGLFVGGLLALVGALGALVGLATGP